MWNGAFHSISPEASGDDQTITKIENSSGEARRSDEERVSGSD